MSQLQHGLPWSLLRDASDKLLLRWIRSLGLLFTERQPSLQLDVSFFLMWKSCCTLRAQPLVTPRCHHRCCGSVLCIYQAGAWLSLFERSERTAAASSRTQRHTGSHPTLKCHTMAPQRDSGLLPWLLTHGLLGPGIKTSNPESQSSGSYLCPNPRLMPRPSSACIKRTHAPSAPEQSRNASSLITQVELLCHGPNRQLLRQLSRGLTLSLCFVY